MSNEISTTFVIQSVAKDLGNIHLMIPGFFAFILTKPLRTLSENDRNKGLKRVYYYLFKLLKG